MIRWLIAIAMLMHGAGHIVFVLAVVYRCADGV